MRPIRTAALGAAGVALLAATAACSDSGSGSTSTDSSGQGDGTSVRAAFDAVAAAAETTRETTSARFEAVMRSPQSAGGELEMSGAMSWDPELAMDITMTGEGLAADPAIPEEIAVVWVDDVMYMNMGAGFGGDFQGRDWLALDLTALAEESGDEAAADALSFGLDEAGQDPAQQLALLLQSPEIEVVGEESLDGVEVTHYQGTISVEDAMERNGSADFLTEEEREELIDVMEQQGIESYDIDVWVDDNDFPVRIHQTYDTSAGPVEYEVRYSDFGTDVEVAAPPAGSVVDFGELLRELGEGTGLGADLG
ncbi:hypothetical protein [Streptomyces specialis]|uniref:hypothetical protein n=1 Tax=Streptomyces specialis TaxID=498367 RepID=UPI00073EDF3D|nr:hypothetical protein [Streptomyces specialis]